MAGDYLRSIEPMIAIALDCMRWKSARHVTCDCEEKDDRRAATIIPRGARNAQLLRKSQIWQSRTMRSVRWQIWSRPALFVANRPLFQEVCRLLQGSPGE